TILDIFEASGADNAGDMSDGEVNERYGVAIPGGVALGGQVTANTMSCTAAQRLGELVLTVLVDHLQPTQLTTRDSLQTAIACVCASGGSTTAVLHLI